LSPCATMIPSLPTELSPTIFRKLRNSFPNNHNDFPFLFIPLLFVSAKFSYLRFFNTHPSSMPTEFRVLRKRRTVRTSIVMPQRIAFAKMIRLNFFHEIAFYAFILLEHQSNSF
jgi:hypothetical protein